MKPTMRPKRPIALAKISITSIFTKSEPFCASASTAALPMSPTERAHASSVKPIVTPAQKRAKPLRYESGSMSFRLDTMMTAEIIPYIATASQNSILMRFLVRTRGTLMAAPTRLEPVSIMPLGDR
jgi:hypothetical protein